MSGHTSWCQRIFVGKQFVNSHRTPAAPPHVGYASCVEHLRYGVQRLFLVNEQMIGVAHRFDFMRRTRHQNDPLGFDALSLAAGEQHLWIAVLIHQHTPQAVSTRRTDIESRRRDPALAGKYLHRQFAAVLAGHCSLDVLEDGRSKAAVVGEFLCTVLDRYTGILADELVIGALVAVLKTAPATYVIDKNNFEVSLARSNVIEKIF